MGARAAIAVPGLVLAAACGVNEGLPSAAASYDRPWATRFGPPRQRLPELPLPVLPDASAERRSPPEREPSPWDVPGGVAPRPWRYVVIHHSATDEGSAAAFRRYHRRKGWAGLAYHFVIGNGQGTPDGVVEMGRRWRRQRIGAHAGSREFNEHGIGVCLVGNFQHARPTAKQMVSLRALLDFLVTRFGIEAENVVRHRDIAQTKCPGRLMPWPIVR